MLQELMFHICFLQVFEAYTDPFEVDTASYDDDESLLVSKDKVRRYSNKFPVDPTVDTTPMVDGCRDILRSVKLKGPIGYYKTHLLRLWDPWVGSLPK